MISTNQVENDAKWLFDMSPEERRDHAFVNGFANAHTHYRNGGFDDNVVTNQMYKPRVEAARRFKELRS